MAAIDGFNISLSTDDVAVSDGMIDGEVIDAAVIDVSELSLEDGDYDIVYDASAEALTLQAAADQAEGDVVLGEATVATDAATAVSWANRGREIPVSADV